MTKRSVTCSEFAGHEDAKPRIRRDNSRIRPMELIVTDVKPIDCVLMRPDGSLAYPKLIGFMDTGADRVSLLTQGEGVQPEHVTDASREDHEGK